MKWAVAKCSRVCISAHRIQIPSLLDSSCQVTLLWHSYFDKHILPRIKLVMGEKPDAHSLFRLTFANNGQLPNKMYVELDFTFLGLKVLNVGVLIIEEPNQVLDKKHHTKLPGNVGWNLIWLYYKTFVREHGIVGFDSFKCPKGVDPLSFSQLCTYHYSDVWKDHTFGATSKVMSQQIEQS